MANNDAKRFTFDPEKEGTEMPTLTSLIYGKKPDPKSLSKGVNQDEGAFTLEPTRALDRNALLSELGKLPSQGVALATELPASTPENADVVLSEFLKKAKSTPSLDDFEKSPVKLPKGLVRPSSWRADTGEPMDVYDQRQLDRVDSPYGPVIEFLLASQKIKSAVIYETTKMSGSSFVATCAVTPEEKRNIFLGSELLPNHFSDLWGRLQKFGYTEFSPVGLASQANSFDRSAVRIAFGADAKEWITLVLQNRITSTQVLLLVSTTSIAATLPSALDKASPAAKKPPAPPRARAA